MPYDKDLRELITALKETSRPIADVVEQELQKLREERSVPIAVNPAKASAVAVISTHA